MVWPVKLLSPPPLLLLLLPPCDSVGRIQGVVEPPKRLPSMWLSALVPLKL